MPLSLPQRAFADAAPRLEILLFITQKNTHFSDFNCCPLCPHLDHILLSCFHVGQYSFPSEHCCLFLTFSSVELPYCLTPSLNRMLHTVEQDHLHGLATGSCSGLLIQKGSVLGFNALLLPSWNPLYFFEQWPSQFNFANHMVGPGLEPCVSTRFPACGICSRHIL